VALIYRACRLIFRVHSQAAAVIAEIYKDMVEPELLECSGSIVRHLLNLLNPNDGHVIQPKRYVVEQVITTLSVLAKASRGRAAEVSRPHSQLFYIMIEM
jgi:hypothetical protein